LDPGTTVLIGTQAAIGFVIDSALNVGIVDKGSARILGTAKTGIICTLFLTNPAIGSAQVNLSVIKKTTQQGD
jgi:hypothetical protein